MRTRQPHRWLTTLGILAAAVLHGGCAGSGESEQRPITVSAASSLTEAFTTIRDDFVAANPGTTVDLNFGSSGQLASQIAAGAPVDVAAFADGTAMSTVEEADVLAASPRFFTSNRLAIITAAANPTGISTITDLSDARIVSLCVETAPCGRLADRVLEQAGVSLDESAVTRGQDAKTTLGAVSQGDADAGLVYVTDARAAGDRVETIALPDSLNATTKYPIAALADSNEPSVAKDFVAWVLGPRGQAALRSAGFLPA